MSPTAVTSDPAALAASVAHWWALAGVDVAIADEPYAWLGLRPAAAPRSAPPVETASAPAEPPAVLPPPPPAPMPEDLDAFLSWLATDADQPEAAISGPRILPVALPRPDLLILTDMPTQEDMAAGRLFSGADAGLLQAMLRAAGLNGGSIGHASLLLARPAGGVIDDRMMDRAAPRLVQFARLIAPRTIILFGDKTTRAFEQVKRVPDTLSTSAVNLNNEMISVVSLPAPFILLRHPERKAAAWGQLRQLAAR